MIFKSVLWSSTTVMVGAVMLVAVCFAAETSLPEPTEKPILTVTGKITVTNKDGAAQFDRVMLESARRGIVFDHDALVQGSGQIRGRSAR